MKTKEKQGMRVAKKFWTEANFEDLASHWNYDEKLPHEIHALIPHLYGAKYVWDPACGNKRITIALNSIFPGTVFMETDIQQWDLSNGVPGWLSDNIDTVLLLGVIQFLNDEDLIALMFGLRYKKVIIRTPVPDKSIYVNKFSKELDADYEACYRDLNALTNIINTTHKLNSIELIYPSHLESKYDTQQLLLVGETCLQE